MSCADQTLKLIVLFYAFLLYLPDIFLKYDQLAPSLFPDMYNIMYIILLFVYTHLYIICATCIVKRNNPRGAYCSSSYISGLWEPFKQLARGWTP